jgi:ADP-ribose pyrophosphatase
MLLKKEAEKIIMTKQKKLILKKSKEDVVHSNPFMDIRHTNVDFGNFYKDYYVVDFGPRAGVVIVNEDDILLVKQYRFLIDKNSWELPGGKVNPGEHTDTGLIRECREETGILCKNLQKLVVYYPGLDNVENRTSIFFTDDFDTISEFKSEETEVVGCKWTPLTECLRMIKEEFILDAMTVAGILAYHSFLIKK